MRRLVLFALLAAGCADGRGVVLVTVTAPGGGVGGIHRFDLHIRQNGMDANPVTITPAQPPIDVPPDFRFSLSFDRTRRGPLTIAVDAIGANQRLTGGTGSGQVDPSGQTEVTVLLETTTPGDLGADLSPPDQAASDLARADLAVADLAVAGDAAKPVDLSSPNDLAAPADLAAPRDLAGSDLSGGLALSFANGVSYLSGLAPRDITVGDFNRDGHLDLVTANRGGNSVGVLPSNNGNGTFLAVKQLVANGAAPSAVVAADLNGDGEVDIATANEGAANVSVLLSTTNFTFANAATYALGNINNPAALVATDLNGDNRPDLVAGSSNFTASVLPNKGDGTFLAATQAAAGGSIACLSSGDWNGDGKRDLLVSTNNGLGFLAGNGDTTFVNPAVVSPTPFLFAVATGDLNGDNKVDVVFVGGNANYDRLLSRTGNGNGGFQNEVSKLVAMNLYDVAVADFNLDGRLDAAAVTSDGKVYVHPGAGDGTFQAPVILAGGNLTFGIVAGDFNEDGKPDLAISDTSGNGVVVFLNTSK